MGANNKKEMKTAADQIKEIIHNRITDLENQYEVLMNGKQFSAAAGTESLISELNALLSSIKSIPVSVVSDTNKGMSEFELRHFANQIADYCKNNYNGEEQIQAFVTKLLKDKPSHGWVSIKDRQPEIYTTAYCCDEDYDPAIAIYAGDNNWQGKDGRPITILYWLNEPLPSPPKSQGHE